MIKKILVAIEPFLTDVTEYSGFEFVINPWGGAPTPDTIAEELAARPYDALITGTKQIKKEIADTCPTLKVISRVGVGYDNVDVKYFRSKGIAVTNTPYGPTNATAEQSMALLLSAVRNIPTYDKELKEGFWKRQMRKGLEESVVAVIGTGRIGRRVAQLLYPFGCRILLHDKYINEEFADKVGGIYCPKEEVLQQADIMMLHMSIEGTNKPWLGEEELMMLEDRSVIIVNAARGALVNEEALYKYLQLHQNSTYCADVFVSEPYKGRLMELHNTIFTPHVSSMTYGSRMGTEKASILNTIAVLNGENCDNIL